jgi:2-polyprenyl-3-methyl-5-hydroxy-6-metoxy-1,4-benzoquinol methylase
MVSTNLGPVRSLCVLTPTSEEVQSSPEWSYLAGFRLLQARRCVQELVERVDTTPVSDLAAVGADAFLLVTSPRVMLTSASLHSMLTEMGRGHELVAAQTSAWTSDPRLEFIHSMRAFEALERDWLGGPRLAAAPWPTPSLLLLASRKALAHLAAREPGLSLAELARRPVAELSWAEPLVAGLCVQFIDFYSEVRSDILPFVPHTAREILEVGCGKGVTGAMLKERLGCRVTGVELSPVAAAAAAAVLDEVLVGDFEQLQIPGRYDVVMALELIEHLKDPFAFLASARGLLRRGGRIVLSTPNSSHWSVVDDLLAGRIDYLATGQFTYTHYRYFTRRTLEDWLAMSGFDRFEIHAEKTSVPPDFVTWARLRGGNEDSLATLRFYVVVDC